MVDEEWPDCPTCGGKGTVWDTTTPIEDFARCPDCVDGKVSIEQLAATWRAVWDDGEKDKVPTPVSIGRATIAAFDNGVDRAFDHLRAVRP